MRWERGNTANRGSEAVHSSAWLCGVAATGTGNAECFRQAQGCDVVWNGAKVGKLIVRWSETSASKSAKADNLPVENPKADEVSYDIDRTGEVMISKCFKRQS